MSMEHDCYTFNKDGSNNFGITNASPGKGLTLSLEDSYANLLMNGDYRGDFKVILHEPEVAPVAKHSRNSFIKVAKGQGLSIALKVTMTETTNEFNAMSLRARGCILDKDKSGTSPSAVNYVDVNCFVEELTSEAIANCNCTPWYLRRNQIESNICDFLGHKCYRKHVKSDKNRNRILSTNCRPGCEQIEYTPHIQDKYQLWTDNPRNQNDEIVHNYVYWGIKEDPGSNVTFGKPNPLIAVYAVNVTNEEYEKERLSRMALININFGEPKATVISKDAKMTFPDMLGSIGGTFGIFLGVSFMGLYDLMSESLGKLRALKLWKSL